MYFHFVCWSLVDSLIFVSRNASQRDKSWQQHQKLFINAIVHSLSLIICSHERTFSSRFWRWRNFHGTFGCLSCALPPLSNCLLSYTWSSAIYKFLCTISLFIFCGWSSNKPLLFLALKLSHTNTHWTHILSHKHIYFSLSLSIFLILDTHEQINMNEL
jgi:hypothetical protein